jgi:hypothetical protein
MARRINASKQRGRAVTGAATELKVYALGDVTEVMRTSPILGAREAFRAS